MWKATFCLMTCGEETEAECLSAIEPFRESIVFQEVRNVYPQIKALNQMLRQVETEFLVPLDADIILNPDAFERVRIAIDFYYHDPHWHSILFKLYDTLTEEEILALKVLRTSVMKKHLFRDGPTPDIEHFRRLTDAGYTCITTYLEKPPIGKHVVRGKHYCYHKYRDVYQTLRTHDWAWDAAVFKGGDSLLLRSKHHYDYFLYKWATTQNEDYLWCIAGMCDGLMMPLQRVSKSLKSRDYQVTADSAIETYSQWYSEELDRQSTIMF